MKIPLVGQSFALRSPAAAAQQTMNLIPQMMDDPNEGSKNKGILVGAPGYHLAGTVTGNIRGSWAGGGTVYVVGGNTLYEITQGSYVGGNPSVGSVTIANSWTLPNASDGKPVQMFGNGNQLLIVANGYAYIDNGSGPVNCQFTNSGYVNPNGTDVQFVSGDNFSTVPNGATIQIDGTPYSVWTVNSPTDLTLTASAGKLPVHQLRLRQHQRHRRAICEQRQLLHGAERRNHSDRRHPVQRLDGQLSHRPEW